ncbi:MAG: carbohydrate ABC transporter permease [Vallitaleaceae bacterium]|nr:carbohydrate ABC transporter permease [Vallitaleaceae bacterium]
MNPKYKVIVQQALIILAATTLLFLCFVPIILMVNTSLKSNAQVYGDFWSFAHPIQWVNYHAAFSLLVRNMINSMIVVSVAVGMTVLLSATSGYVFSRIEFPGKAVLYMMVISLMMIPGILTLTPLYKLVLAMHLKNTWIGLIAPWISGGQVFGIILCRTFMKEMPDSIFEAARIDGCSELKALFKIAMPLSKPILATLMIMNMMGFYNDYIWPLMIIDSNKLQVITVAIKVFQAANGTVDIGSMLAGYVIATVPLLILFIFGSRLYIEGITSGAVKA